MKDTRYVFAGNRAFVLERMLELGLNVVKIWAVEGSYLQRYLEEKSMEYSLVEDKEKFICEIESCNFDYFISNGLPVILPVGKLKNENADKKFINIHPSLLPELRGRDPIPGALLFQKDSGATCHLMDDGIDTGDIIAQIRIENTEDLDAGLLYQLSFLAEGDVFESAYHRNFEPCHIQKNIGNGSYYSFKKDDLYIDLKQESVEKIIAKVRAFSTRNKGAYFEYQGKSYRCVEAREIVNRYLIDRMTECENNSVIIAYEDKIIYKKNERYLKLSIVQQ